MSNINLILSMVQYEHKWENPLATWQLFCHEMVAILFLREYAENVPSINSDILIGCRSKIRFYIQLFNN